MAFAAMIGPLISGIASIAGALVSASAASQQAQAEQEAANFNAEKQRQEAAWAQSKGAQESAATAKQYDQKAAEARAAQAQGGLSTTEGSPLLVQTQFAADKFFNQNVQMANATKTQRDFEDKAKITEFEGAVRANAARAQGTASLLSGVAGAVKSIGGSSASSGAFG